jgi:hypothetical protein
MRQAGWPPSGDGGFLGGSELPNSRRAAATTGHGRETALYLPLKRFLEERGYEVKAEVVGCDLVARRGDEPPVIVELKLRFGLPLLLQGIDRLALSERVYLAVPRPPAARLGRPLGPASADIRRLCRRLGLGLIVVGNARRPVEVLEEPRPYRPRRATHRVRRLEDEFARRIGDANLGGVAGVPLVTAYRQDALRCARALAVGGPLPVAGLRAASAVPSATRIVQQNVYGWFARVARGTYALTGDGRQALIRFADALAALPVPAGSPSIPR